LEAVQNKFVSLECYQKSIAFLTFPKWNVACIIGLVWKMWLFAFPYLWLFCKVEGFVLGNRVPMDLFCKSMDLYRIVTTNLESKKVWSVPYKTNPGFVSYCGSRIRTWKDLFWVVYHKSSQFSKDLTCFHESTNSQESLVHRRTMNSESIQILCFGFANPYPVQKIRFVYCVLKICFVDSIWIPVFKLLVLCIHLGIFLNFFFLKFLYLYWFGRIHIWILQSYFFVPHQLVII
jgi:hypothetical protein